MADGEERRITQVVSDFLKTADISVVTERMVLAYVDETLKLSKPIQEYKKLVSATIDDFLSKLDAEEEGDEDDEEENEPVGAKRGRGAGASKDAAGAKQKKPRSGSTGETLHIAELGNHFKAQVRRLNDKLFVDVREFYMADGTEAASSKGLCMDVSQWSLLCKALPALVEALRQGDTQAPAVQLSRARMAKITEFRSVAYLSIREYYEKDGEMLPSKTGVNLALPAAEALLKAADDVTQAAGGPVDAPPPPPPERSAAAAAPTAIEGREAVVDLGRGKRLSISNFKGRLSVDIREFYQSDGEWKPGKKGIMLSPSDWKTLSDHMDEINSVLKRKDMNYELKLSGMRRVRLSEFKGVYYVGVREFYEKDGKLQPGAKGLNMNPQEWAACVAGAPTINAALPRE